MLQIVTNVQTSKNINMAKCLSEAAQNKAFQDRKNLGSLKAESRSMLFEESFNALSNPTVKY